MISINLISSTFNSAVSNLINSFDVILNVNDISGLLKFNSVALVILFKWYDNNYDLTPSLST